MEYYLESLNQEKIIYSFDKFDADAIKQCITNYFKFGQNQDDELWYYKVSNDRKTVGDDYIDAFVFHNGKVCKEITKGDRIFYKPLK